MKFSEYAKSKMLNIVMWFVSMIFILGVMRIEITKPSFYYFVFVISFIFFAIPFFVEFYKKKSFYDTIENLTDNFDKPYLLSEMIDRPNFKEGEILYQTLKISNKSMCDEIARYKVSKKEYEEYIEKWVHEIKTPISACKLAVENRDENLAEEISENVEKIEKYVNQTLFYSRVNNVENDYIIRPHKLETLVGNSLKSNARMLIKNGFSIKRENLDITANTDEKWIGFILDQIISNSQKYKSENPRIVFSGEKRENAVILKVTDNGIGISKDDLPRIFEKNFTGGNGRLSNKSTGFGLYICKKLCIKMGIEIYGESEKGKYTTIKIVFPAKEFQ